MAPQITGVVSLGRTKKGLSSITLGFSQSMDAVAAGNAALYQVLGAAKTRKKHQPPAYTKPLPIRVMFNRGANTVTIALAKPVKGSVEVMVQGGLTPGGGGPASASYTRVVS